MPVYKNSFLRYQVLDRCFSDFTRKYEINDLVDAVNNALTDAGFKTISLRIIREDIKYMRSIDGMDAPIETIQYDGKKCYYRYSKRRFSIFNNDLSAREVKELKSTIDMLNSYHGIPAKAWLDEVVSNLEYRFGIRSNKENIISFEQNEQLKGLELLSELIDAIVSHDVLKIHYRTYKGKDITTLFHPYHLKQYNNRWFLFGLEMNEKYGNQIINKALDRIVSYECADDVSFIPNNDVDFSTYFNDFIGVTPPKDHPVPEKIVLRFDEERFPYIVSKPIHHSQKVQDEKERTISLFLRFNKELESLIFSYGPQVEVVSPLWIRKQIKEKMKKIVNTIYL